MESRLSLLVTLAAIAFWSLGDNRALPQAAGPSPDALPATQPAPGVAPANAAGIEELLNLDLEQLSNVRVSSAPPESNVNAPSSQVSTGSVNTMDATTTGEMARQAPSVSTRRTSAINLDPRVRGYHSGQLNATANGMSEVKTRLDIDSVLSQIDPGIVENITIIDGPYTSLYGPGFAFMNVELLPVLRYPDGPEAHGDTTFQYGSNGQTLYTRENILGGGKDWGARVSYGLRAGDDYWTGGAHPYRVPSSYQKWDGLFAVSVDLSPIARMEFNYIRCEMNNVELPGVVYDLDSSTNNQFNVRYIVQQDRQGPQDLVFQTWLQQTSYQGNALRPTKQDTLYQQFFTLPTLSEDPINTQGRGQSDSLGVRFLRTFGERDAAQWTLGADWRRFHQYYREENFNSAGDIVLGGGDVYGIPGSQMNDLGILTDVRMPWSERVTFNAGGRLDYCSAALNREDPIVTQFSDPAQAYYAPGLNQPSALLGMAYLTGKWKLTEQTTFNAGTAYAMRMPDLTELYSDDPFVPVARFGNSYISGLSTLAPEKNLQFDVGITTVKERVSYGVRGFYALVWDYITPTPAFIDGSPPGSIAAPKTLGRDFAYFAPQWRQDLITGNVNADTNQAGYQYENVDLATLAGGDLFAEVQCLDWLSLYGNMAYVRGTNWRPVTYVAADSWIASEGKLVPVGKPEGLPNIYPFNGTLALRMYDPQRERWLVEFSSRIVAAQTYVATSLSELPTPGFVTFALRGYYQARKNLRLTMAIENLFNLDYTEHGSLVMIDPQGLPTFVKEPGISVVTGIDARF